MVWKHAKEMLPDEGKSVLIFRIKNKTYSIAQLIKDSKHSFKTLDGRLGKSEKLIWRHSTGCPLKFDLDDYWCEFEPFTYIKTFT